jgi:hypothetical protein
MKEARAAKVAATPRRELLPQDCHSYNTTDVPGVGLIHGDRRFRRSSSP